MRGNCLKCISSIRKHFCGKVKLTYDLNNKLLENMWVKIRDDVIESSQLFLKI